MKLVAAAQRRYEQEAAQAAEAAHAELRRLAPAQRRAFANAFTRAWLEKAVRLCCETRVALEYRY